MGKITDQPALATRKGTAIVTLVDVDDDLNKQQTVDVLFTGIATEAYVNSAVEGSQHSGNYLVDGGGVLYSGTGYDYHVAAATYVIQGVEYSSPADDITLSAADPSLDRIDIIAVDTTNAVAVIAGTPAANPQLPDVDPDTQLQLTFVYVAAASTTPTVTTTDVYLNNAEWTYNDSTGRLDPDSTAGPRSGSKSIEATSVIAGDQLTLTYPGVGTVDASQYNSLVFWIKPKATWPNAKSLKVYFLNASSAQVGSVVTVQQGTFGLDTSTIGYQAIVIPLSSFALTGLTFTKLRIRVAGGGAAIGWFIDDIALQAGVTSNNASGLMQFIGPWSSAVAYSKQNVVTTGGYQYVALAANQNSTPQPDNSNANWYNLGLARRFDTDGTLAANSDSLIATQKATKTYAGTVATAAQTAAQAYADSLVVGLWDDRGNFDASGGSYPSSGGSGSAGAVKKGDIWTINVAGTLPTGQIVEAGDTVRALIDTPGNTQANWAIAQNNIGYTPLPASYLDTDGTLSANSDTKIASQKATKTYVDAITAAATHAATSKATPVDADEMPVADSAASYALKKLTWGNLKATLKTYLDTLYAAIGAITSSGLTMATGKLLGRTTASTGAIEEITVGTGLTLTTGTLSASRAPPIQAVTSSSTVTPTFDDDLVKITAQAVALTLANPTGTAIPALGIVIRIKDNGTARAISYGTQYRAIGITLPTTTVISKTTYIAMIWNSDDSKWDCIATGTEA